MLKRLETRHDRMPRKERVLFGVLPGRTVTASDVAALGTAPQVKPPTSCGEALYATCPGWLRVWIDSFDVFHGRLGTQLLAKALRNWNRLIVVGGNPTLGGLPFRDWVI